MVGEVVPIGRIAHSSINRISQNAATPKIGRVDPKWQASLLDSLVQGKIGHTWFDDTRCVFSIKRQQLVHAAAQIEDNTSGHARCGSTVSDIPAQRDGVEREQVGVGPADGGRYFCRRGRVDSS